ncbi:right-handed parallel beta-helix repeat-containing protein [Bacillus spongiae]|uniref:Right-handed parallel beta-helix repeat-containing protein n=1 Tax=Bacillus spongiae TaxID=2683610 RepID=A0ABU8HHX6_9BACI
MLRIVPTVAFPTVQDAINASSPGDSIKILAGKFDGFEVTVENLKIFGCGIGRTIIDGEPADILGRGVIVSENQTILQKFTVQGFPLDGVFVNSNNNILKDIESKLNNGPTASDGIQVGGDNNLLIQCTTLFNGDDGFEVNAAEHNCLINCLGVTNADNGVNITGGSENNKFLKVTSEKNLGEGFFVNSDFNTLLNNIISQNITRGILVGGDSNNSIIDNLVCNNTGSGMDIENNSNDNIIDSNTVNNNGTQAINDGITVQDGAIGNTIRFNKARNNFEFDIQALGNAFADNTYDGNQCGDSDPATICGS